MTKQLDGFLSLNCSSKKMEVFPEMLDYSYIDECNNVDELRAIMSSLLLGEHGKYPHLEETVRDKVMTLLPESKQKLVAMKSKLSVEETDVEKKLLQEWLEKLNTNNKQGKSSVTISCPIRNTMVTCIKQIKSDVKINKLAKTIPEKKPICKDKLSTKEYYELRTKYPDNSYFNVEDGTVDTIKFELRDRISNNEYSQLERKWLSEREREKGNEHFKSNENDEAYHCYSKSVLIDPTNAKSYANRAAVLLRLGKHQRAIDDCTQAIGIDGMYTKALARRGMILYQLRQYEEAAADFKMCDSIDPNGGHSRMHAKSEEKLREKLDGAVMSRLIIEEVDDIDEIKEEVITPGVLAESGSVKGKLCDRKTVDSSSRIHSEHNEQQRDNLSQKIRMVEVENSDKECIQDDLLCEEESFLMKRVEIIEDDGHGNGSNITSNSLKAEGNAAMTVKEFDRAIILYSQALELDASNASAYNNRALAYLQVLQFVKATDDATSCLELEPRNTKALYRRGLAKLMSSKCNIDAIKSAEVDFITALSFKPPKDQQRILSKKLKECQKMSIQASCDNFNNGAKSKAKQQCISSRKNVKPMKRSHDSTALCF